MSIQALTYVLEGHPAKGADRLVLLSLANHANGTDYECWPSAELIAWETNLSLDHVRRCLRALDNAGWITRKVNAAPDERIPADRRPNLYRIVPGVQRRVRANVLPVESARVGDPRADGYVNGAPAGTRNPPTKPSGEPSGEPSLELVLDDATSALSFAGFWNVYPYKRGSRAAAERAWASALKVAPARVIIEGAERLRLDPNLPPKAEERFVRHGSTWLRDRGWEDGPLPQRHGGSPPPLIDDDRQREGDGWELVDGEWVTG